jgi:hypothetical protein
VLNGAAADLGCRRLFHRDTRTMGGVVDPNPILPLVIERYSISKVAIPSFSMSTGLAARPLERAKRCVGYRSSISCCRRLSLVVGATAVIGMHCHDVWVHSTEIIWLRECCVRFQRIQ